MMRFTSFLSRPLPIKYLPMLYFSDASSET